jgi:hypothetical protein
VAQPLVGFELRGRLVAAHAEVCRTHHDGGHPVVDARHRYACHLVLGRTGRQQRATTRACGVLEVEHDRGRSARHAVNRGVAGVLDRPARRRHVRGRPASGVGHPDRNHRLIVGGLQQTTLNGERPHPGEQVAAVMPV